MNVLQSRFNIFVNRRVFFTVAALVNYTKRVIVVIKFNNSSNYHKYLKFRLKNTSFYESRLREVLNVIELHGSKQITSLEI